jgi:predicted nucleotidyltransferase
LGIGLFGSLVQGNWGPGSDLDIIIVLKDSSLPFIERGRDFDFSEMPVPVDLLVYTEKEWNSLKKERPKGLPSRVKWVLKRF